MIRADIKHVVKWDASKFKACYGLVYFMISYSIKILYKKIIIIINLVQTNNNNIIKIIIQTNGYIYGHTRFKI